MPGEAVDEGQLLYKDFLSVRHRELLPAAERPPQRRAPRVNDRLPTRSTGSLLLGFRLAARTRAWTAGLAHTAKSFTVRSPSSRKEPMKKKSAPAPGLLANFGPALTLLAQSFPDGWAPDDGSAYG